MQIYTKESLIEKLREISQRGWIPNARKGNQGGIGNTLEDLLGIEENNLPLPNAAEWELKTQRSKTTSLITLFHSEPSPRAIRFVSRVLLPHYGWPHQEAGRRYHQGEMSFRQTISAMSHSDRGFTVQIDKSDEKLTISFDSSKVDKRHKDWLDFVTRNVGMGELEPQPYWGFDDLHHKVGTKLLNCFFAKAEVKRIEGENHFWYKEIYMLKGFSFDGFLAGLEEGAILVDFDARTGHNHGTKFRLRQGYWPNLYSEVTKITD